MIHASLSDALRRSLRLTLAGTAILAAMQAAQAGDDAGVHAFFSSIFGAGAAQTTVSSASAADESVAVPQGSTVRSRPLTVRLKPRIVAAQGPTKPVKVSIFEDRTLRRGDAVMTAEGIRIFAGSTSWPYSAEDFVSLDDAGHLTKDMTRSLVELDRAPRG